MSLTFNLRLVEKESLRLQGELTAAELGIETLDELVRVARPLTYDLEVEKLDQAVLARGKLELPLNCECVRCLRPFETTLRLPDWAVHLPLEGEEKVSAVNDCVDLTPYVREDIVLAFPQHPLCEEECSGLKSPLLIPAEATGRPKQPANSAWVELNKLKLEN